MRPYRRMFLTAFALLFTLPALLASSPAHAGIYDAEDEVTYKEYWVPHDQWPSYDPIDTVDCEADRVFRNWFLEPSRRCEAVITFDIPDDVSGAARAEIYVDLWRAYVEQASTFRLNDGRLIRADVGLDWSRTPYIGPIDLNEINQGANTLTFPRARPHHAHDIALRIYYDNQNPIDAGPGSDVTAPTGELRTVKGDSGTIDAADGGTLSINNNKITLTASVNNDAAFVEFHGYYFGYDEDNDGEWLDWHSRGRNNCHPGGVAGRCRAGSPEGGEFGTIDHIGTVKTNGAGQYSVVWDVSTVPDQAGVRFKIRVVDDQHNVRDAAGGVSGEFTLERSRPKVFFFNRGFQDTGLSVAPRENIVEEVRTIELPEDVNAFENPLVVQSFWNGAQLYINELGSFNPKFANGDNWQLSTNSFNNSWLMGGTNVLRYYSEGMAFVERPGPMFVLQRKANPGDDSSPPQVFNLYPSRNAVDVNADTAIEFQLFDAVQGVDRTTIELTVNGAAVTPSIIGNEYSYLVQYRPPVPFSVGQVVDVTIDACDKGNRCLEQESYRFTVYKEPVDSDVVSDDFNRCTDPLLGDQWILRNPKGDIGHQVDGEHFIMTVPSGTRHDLWSNNKDAGRLVQPIIDGDFEVEAKFLTLPDPQQRFQVQGIVVEEDADNFLRFDLSSNGSEVKIGAYLVQDDTATGRGATQTIDTTSGHDAFYLRVARSGNQWQASYSFDHDEWNSFANFTQFLNVTTVGVHAGNAGENPEFISVVDYFFNRSSPIDPEDETVNRLAEPQVVGNGAVSVTPECGAPLTLAAIPGGPDWRFAGWSGSLTGDENPATLNRISSGDSITATFKLVRQLTLAVNGPGTVTKSPDQSEYLDGDSVDLSATPTAGARFLGWSGDLSGTASTQSLLMDGDKQVTATFATVYSLNVGTLGTGTVAVSPTSSAGLAAGEYVDGAEVTLTPIAAGTWRFAGWEGDLSGTDAPATIVIDSDKTITARFIDARKLTVNRIGSGAGAIDIDPPSVDGYYAKDTVVTLTAEPGAETLFDGWSGDVSSSSASIQVLLDQDRTVTAAFLALYTVTAGTDGQGVVTVDPQQDRYPEGTAVTFQATPVPDWVFVGWTGIPGSENPAVIRIERNLAVTAVFSENPTTLTKSIAGDGTIQANPDRTTFASHESVTLEAVPAPGWRFDGWSGDLPVDANASANPLTLTMESDRTIAVRFVRDEGRIFLPFVRR